MANLVFAVVMSAFLFAYAGWTMLTSGGSSELYSKGKRVFGNVLIGLIIILAGWIIIDTLLKTFTGGGLTRGGICAVAKLLSNYEHFYA